MGSTLAPTEVWSTISTAMVDADSPIDITLMGGIRGNLINVQEQLTGAAGSTYVGAQLHDHDGLNSKLISPKTYSTGAHAIFRSTVQSTGNASTVYVEQLAVGLPFAGSLRIRYDLKGLSTDSAGFANANIFRNGSAVGTESSVSLTASTLFITFTEDVAGWLANDVLTIKTKVTPSAISTSVAKNLVISVSTASISQIALTVLLPATT